MTRRAFLAASAAAAAQAPLAFRWPEGKRVAVSLTFDDARLSQPDTGLALLRKLGAKATFYLVPDRASERLDGWKQAVKDGHEIGSHTRLHPCTANYRFSRERALEAYTLDRMDAELDGSIADIERMLGTRPVSFAYPCGQKFVGRGEETRSYVPVVAKRFQTGRGYLDESPNDPLLCDFAQLMGTPFDDLDFAAMRGIIEGAARENRWVVLVGHEIGKRGRQITDVGALTELVRYAQDPASGVWLDTVRNVAAYVRKARMA